MLRVSRPGEVAVVLACGLCEWLGVPERVGAWLGGDGR